MSLTYAKVLIPSEPSVPLIVVAVTNKKSIEPYLVDQGWTTFPTPPPINQGRVTASRDGLRILVGDQVMHEDHVNPISPPGWWDAVNRNGGNCAVLAVATAEVPSFEQDQLAQSLDALFDSGHGHWSWLPIDHQQL